MATIFPDVKPETIEVDSERLVYVALQQLPAAYVVLHSYPWLRSGRHDLEAPLAEGEADFVLLHPERGLLVLEVKGGELELRSGVWYRKTKAGLKEIRDPFKQARRNMHALIDLFEERLKGRFSRHALSYGYAVAFPHHVYVGALPANADSSLMIDDRALQDPLGAIEGAYTAWSGRMGKAPQLDLKPLIDTLLPRLRIIRSSVRQVRQEEQAIVRMTEAQTQLFRGLLCNRRVSVEGVAGSGKTLLAQEAAVDMASRGQDVLLLCYNRELCTWLQERTSGDSRLEAAGGRLEVRTFHELVWHVCRKAGVALPAPAETAPQFWEETAANVLDQALHLLLALGTPHSYDAVVVDEGQDFPELWWYELDYLLRDATIGSLLAFFDTAQRLREQGTAPPLRFETHFELKTSCRSTAAIAQSGGSLLGVPVQLLPGSPPGRAPHHRRARSSEAQAGLTLGVVRALLEDGFRPEQIALLGPARWQRGALRRTRAIGEYPLVERADLWRQGGKILCSTPRSFKGLEADVIVLYDLGGFSEYFTERDLYVAWTRAKHILEIISHGQVTRAIVERALEGVHSR